MAKVVADPNCKQKEQVMQWMRMKWREAGLSEQRSAMDKLDFFHTPNNFCLLAVAKLEFLCHLKQHRALPPAMQCGVCSAFCNATASVVSSNCEFHMCNQNKTNQLSYPATWKKDDHDKQIPYSIGTPPYDCDVI